jgi:proteasome lid subunit RPN8/RPN11
MSKPAPSAPDVRQLDPKNLPESAFPGGKDQAFRVYIEPTVHTQVAKHSSDDVSVEICGILVGKLVRDADGPFVHISESIRGDAATNKFAEVTFTHETWAKINREMDTRFSHLAIIGWYHSHPGFGVFLSDRDRFIQENFFSGPGQVAYVVDPVRKTEGVFVWHEGKPVLTPHYWVGNRIHFGGATGNEPASMPGQPGQPLPAEVQPSPAGETRGRGGWLPLVTQGALLLMVFLLGIFLAGKMDAFERARIEQNALARGWLARKNPSLREEINEAGRDLVAAARMTKTLSEEHLKLLSEPQETKEKWNDVVSRLDKALGRMAQIQVAYGLTPDEAAFLKALAARAAEDDKKKQPTDDKSAEQAKPDDKNKPNDEKPTDKNP